MCKIPPKYRFFGIVRNADGFQIEVQNEAESLKELLNEAVIEFVQKTDEQCGCRTYEYFMSVSGSVVKMNGEMISDEETFVTNSEIENLLNKEYYTVSVSELDDETRCF